MLNILLTGPVPTCFQPVLQHLKPASRLWIAELLNDGVETGFLRLKVPFMLFCFYEYVLLLAFVLATMPYGLFVTACHFVIFVYNTQFCTNCPIA